MNNKEEQNIQVKEKIKEKKVYLSDSKNDNNQKLAVDYLKKVIVKNVIYAYTGKKPSGIEYKLFYRHFQSRTKPSKSPNDFNFRIERIYNAIVSMYSDFVESYGDILTDAKSIMNESQIKDKGYSRKEELILNQD